MTALPEMPRPLLDVAAPSDGGLRRLPAPVRLAARARGLSTCCGAILVTGALVLRVLPLPGGLPGHLLVPAVATGAGALGVALLLLGVALGVASPAATGETPHALAVPLLGRSTDLVGPGSPSAGTHAYGQALAVHLVHEDTEGPDGSPDGSPDGGTGGGGAGLLHRLGLHRPERFASFGQPVLAVADATVVRVVDGVRDHRSRSSRAARALAAVEGAVRELLGARAVLGNHVVLDVGGGRYAVCAHLQRGSVFVEVGDRVLPGDEVAAVGSSGSTCRPHLHLQLNDSPRPLVAAGLPVALTGA